MAMLPSEPLTRDYYELLGPWRQPHGISDAPNCSPLREIEVIKHRCSLVVLRADKMDSRETVTSLDGWHPEFQSRSPGCRNCVKMRRKIALLSVVAYRSHHVFLKFESCPKGEGFLP